MTSTPFDVAVFDFDGTLVDSAAIKRQAFFDIFPPGFAPAVEAALKKNPDGSRHQVIPEMIAQAKLLGIEIKGMDSAALAAAYGARVAGLVAEAPEMPGASRVLVWAAQNGPVYIASMTPHDEIQHHVQRLAWNAWVSEAFGFPHRKPEVVAALLKRHSIRPERLVVVGDGISDREAAEVNGTQFHQITSRDSLMRIPGFDEVQNA